MSADQWAAHDGHWDRISGLFEAVLSLPSQERAAFLDQSCGTNTPLRSELESLVAAYNGAPGFLEAFYADVIHPALAHADVVPEPDASRSAAAARDVIAQGSRIRHFTVHERLGSGGAGVVYRGRDTMLERDVAMKFLAPSLGADADARARLIREAQAASRLEHPNVCAIHAVEATADGGLCIVMAYCAGGTLRDRLRSGAIPSAEINAIALDLAKGLASAHRAGIVHGDIKPANVGFGEGDVARLLDFGVSVYAHEAATGTRGLRGTLPYLAPELWRGGTRGPRTDVWALGVTFFEMVTGRRPFAGKAAGALAGAILAAELPSTLRPDGAEIAPEFDALIRRMLSAMPEQRPADGAAVLEALAGAPRARTSVAPSATPSVDDGQPVAPTSRSPWARNLVLSVGAAALLGVLLTIAPPTPQRIASPPAVEVARTSQPLSSIAVLPFNVRGGRDIAYLSNGMVDLLTPAFDATGLVRGIDPNTVIGAANDHRAASMDSTEARAIAAGVRADRYVTGSVVGTGATLTFRATLRRIDGREVGRAQVVVADSNALASGIDALVRQLIATELLAPGDTIAGIAAATTTSTRALRSYLDGERDLRDARPAAAVASFQSAVATDSMFALAWYRLARAARWNDVDSLSASAARRANQLAASLPPRQQTLVRAYYTLRFGSAVQAERQLAQIAADYPTDVEAWMLLGEVQFGSNPFYGRPIDDAAATFGRVMSLDPRNREVTVYLMDLADRADRTGQLDTLFNMYFSPNSAGEQPGIRATYIALYGRRSRAPTPKRVAENAFVDPALARVALHRISADVRDRGAARAYAGIVASAGEYRTDGLLSLAILDVADGNWDGATTHFREAAARDPHDALEYRALFALAPSVAVSPDSLRALRRLLVLPRNPRMAPVGDLSLNERDDIRRYLSGLLSVRLGDASGVAAAREALSKRSAQASSLAGALAAAITGHWQLSRGNPSAAIAAFEQCIPDLPARIRSLHPALEQHLDRLARADALQRLGRRSEAQRWYQSLREGSGVIGAPFVAAADSGVRAVSNRP